MQHPINSICENDLSISSDNDHFGQLLLALLEMQNYSAELEK